MRRWAVRMLVGTGCAAFLALATVAHGVKPPGPGGVPSAPTGVSAAVVYPHHVALSWNANPEPDVAGYNVFRNSAPKGTYRKLTPSPVAATSFVDTTTAAGETWYYRVSAVNAAGAEGKQSAPVAVTVVEVPDTFPPGSPSAFGAVPGFGLVTLAWTNPLDNDVAGTTVRYALSGYPAGPQEGTAVCDRPAAPGAADSFVHQGLENGRTYYYAAFSYDGSGNYSGAATAVAVPFDNVAPVIGGVGADNVTVDGALIRWTTDEPADSQVEYGLTAAYGSATPRDAALATGHFVFLTGLAPATLYHYRVVSADASGNTSVSGDMTFVTAALQGLACRDCHVELPQETYFGSDGHGKAGIALSCESCHTSGHEHSFTYKELKPVNGFTYPALATDLWATTVDRKNYCLYACHVPATKHPNGVEYTGPDNTARYIEILTPEGYIAKLGYDPNIILPAAPELKLLDVDGNGINSYGDIVMCATCHDVHGTAAIRTMIPLDNSVPLCTQCHNMR